MLLLKNYLCLCMNNDRLLKLEAFLKDSPSDPFLLFAVAKEYEKLEQIENAMNGYLKLREVKPDYIGLYYHLAKLYEVLNKDLKALEIYKEGIDLAKSLGDFHALSELNNAKMNLEIQLGN